MPNSFLYTAIFLKIYFVMILIGAFIMNLASRNSQQMKKIDEFPSQEPLLFTAENLLLGITAGISTAVIAWCRGRSIIFYFWITFFIIIALNLLFQYSGAYLILYGHYDWDTTQKIYYIVNSIVFGILFITCIIFSWLEYDKSYSVAFLQPGTIRWRVLEILVFVIAYSLPFLWIDQNRTGRVSWVDVKETIMTMIAFLVLFFALEFSGLWSSFGLGLPKRICVSK